MNDTLCFTVHGDPVPKQSFRVAGRGRGFQPARVTAWAELVAWEARTALGGLPPLAGPVRVELDFYLRTARRVDLDNLVKNVADALTAAGVWTDDAQVVDLHARKHRAPDAARVTIVVAAAPETGA